MSGENLTSRIRSILFKAMLRQEIGWYDDERNSTAALATKLSHDAGQLEGVWLEGGRSVLLLEFEGVLLLAKC